MRKLLVVLPNIAALALAGCQSNLDQPATFSGVTQTMVDRYIPFTNSANEAARQHAYLIAYLEDGVFLEDHEGCNVSYSDFELEDAPLCFNKPLIRSEDIRKLNAALIAINAYAEIMERLSASANVGTSRTRATNLETQLNGLRTVLISENVISEGDDLVLGINIMARTISSAVTEGRREDAVKEMVNSGHDGVEKLANAVEPLVEGLHYVRNGYIQQSIQKLSAEYVDRTKNAQLPHEDGNYSLFSRDDRLDLLSQIQLMKSADVTKNAETIKAALSSFVSTHDQLRKYLNEEVGEDDIEASLEAFSTSISKLTVALASDNHPTLSGN